MDFLKSDVARIILATTAAFLFGGLYHNPTLNPYMETWKNLTYPNITDPRTVKDPLLPMIGSAVSQLGIATIMNRYVNVRQLSTTRLFTMASELFGLVALFAFPKTLWNNGSLVKFVIEHVYDFFVSLILAMTLGYRRFPVSAHG